MFTLEMLCLWYRIVVRRTLFCIIYLVGSGLMAQAGPKPVAVRAFCDGRISSAVLSSFKEQISSSPKYKVANSLDDGDLVFTVNISCAERDNVAAIAIVYGLAKCFGEKNCHLSIDGSSLKSDLCDYNSAAKCGRALFEAFDTYASNPLASRRLKLN